MIDLKAYRDSVGVLARLNSDFVFHNNTAEHAAIVMEAIIRHAKERVRIFEDELCGDLLDKNELLLDSIEEKVGRRMRVDIVLQKNLGNRGKNERVTRLLSIADANPDYLVVRTASPAFVKSITEINGSLSFVSVGDKSSFRLENAAVPRKALCSFKGPVVAGLIAKKFDAQFSSCPAYV
jgi:hypothetical protein